MVILHNTGRVDSININVNNQILTHDMSGFLVSRIVVIKWREQVVLYFRVRQLPVLE